MSNRDSATSLSRNNDTASCWRTLRFGVARQPAERLAALRLVHQRYAAARLIEPSQLKLRVTPHHLSSSTTIFVGVVGKSVWCTVSLVGDSRLGLPLESIYSGEVARLRNQGRRLAEVSCLAFSDRGSSRTFGKAFIGLNRIMAQSARHQGYDSLLMTCNPRHLAYYEKKMRFRQIGGVKQYPSVKNRPAVASVLHLDQINAENCPFFAPVFSTPLPAAELDPSPITSAEHRLLSIASTDAPRTILPLSA